MFAANALLHCIMRNRVLVRGRKSEPGVLVNPQVRVLLRVWGCELWECSCTHEDPCSLITGHLT